MKLRTLILLLMLGSLDLPVSGGEFYRQFQSSVGTNEGCVWIGKFPFLVDTNNTGVKLTGAPVNLESLKRSGAVSGLRLGMTMDEAVGHWGKPPAGYAPIGCLHGLATFIYGDAALGFEGNRLETIQIRPRTELAQGLSRVSKPDDFVSALGSPTDRRTSGANCNLVYLSPSRDCYALSRT